MQALLEKNYHHLLIALKEEIIQELEKKFISSEIKIDNLDKPMTSKETCNHYNISSSTLERYVRSGLKFKNTGKKTKRIFTKNEFENFLNKQNYGRR